MTTLETLSQHRCFGGTVSFHRHAASSTQCAMRFAVFTPPQAATRKVPVLYFLAGLTCTEENFIVKAGAQRIAAELGLMLVAPDTSPRGVPIPGDSDSWDFGVGAGYYLDATQAPWSAHYRMYSYVTQELPSLIAAHFNADMQRQGIFGHSMGGHGALTIGLKHPEQYKSISAFAPLSAPMQCGWGVKALTNYLGTDQNTWLQYDATELASRITTPSRYSHILIDQGMSDQFLDNLKPHLFAQAAQRSGLQVTLREQPGYDHGYYFVSSFIEDHLRHHATLLT